MNVHKDVKLTFRALLFPKMRFFSVATLGPDSHTASAFCGYYFGFCLHTNNIHAFYF